MGIEISLRRAADADSTDLWHWRNDEETRRMSRTTEIVDWDSHTDWFASSLLDPRRILLVGRVEGVAESVGMVRFDLDDTGNSAEVSINLNPAHRGKGMSKPLLASAIAHFREFHDVPIIADIKRTNIPSIKCFEGVGFELYSSEGDFHTCRLI